MTDDYTKARDAAAEAYSPFVMSDGTWNELSRGRYQGFLKGADWGYERGKAESLPTFIKLDEKNMKLIEQRNDALEQLTEAKALIAQMAEALKQYADKARWSARKIPLGNGQSASAPGLFFGPNIAIEALTALEKLAEAK